MPVLSPLPASRVHDKVKNSVKRSGWFRHYFDSTDLYTASRNNSRLEGGFAEEEVENAGEYSNR